ncbi:hypothetical protein FZI91_19670 [Mycobacterium sp. CBMA271]|uniref:hypothetical protein n=1 Tax=unclassified Mycobacteroides TaxID=2618759 RepID=UPI0012DCA2FF|nr:MULTISPECIES: hypothetical protein [unclassified Mycobacteroides]MUM17264.1 hypothetical protein [Mycobacteroides sp. CBMA 326]MUM23904.1 hypothetical protein [Mycobacteroides sp. CBMA 271]
MSVDSWIRGWGRVLRVIWPGIVMGLVGAAPFATGAVFAALGAARPWDWCAVVVDLGVALIVAAALLLLYSHWRLIERPTRRDWKSRAGGRLVFGFGWLLVALVFVPDVVRAPENATNWFFLGLGTLVVLIRTTDLVGQSRYLTDPSRKPPDGGHVP